MPHLKHCCDPQIFYCSRKDSIASHSLTLKAQGRHEATEIFESFPYDLLGYLIHHVHLSTTFLLDYSFDQIVADETKTTISDLVQIPPVEFYKRSLHAVEDKINEKYSNKVFLLFANIQ